MLTRTIWDACIVDLYITNGVLAWLWLIVEKCVRPYSDLSIIGETSNLKDGVQLATTLSKEQSGLGVISSSEGNGKETIFLFNSEKEKVNDVEKQIDESRAADRYVIMMNMCEVIITFC